MLTITYFPEDESAVKMNELVAAESRARARVAVLEERLAASASATEELARLGTQLEMEKTMRAGIEQEHKRYCKWFSISSIRINLFVL